jgi:hypothetical protein
MPVPLFSLLGVLSKLRRCSHQRLCCRLGKVFLLVKRRTLHLSIRMIGVRCSRKTKW